MSSGERARPLLATVVPASCAGLLVFARPESPAEDVGELAARLGRAGRWSAGAMPLLLGLLHRGRVVQRVRDQLVEFRQPVGREPRHLRPPARDLLHRHDLGVPLRGCFPGGPPRTPGRP